MLSATLGQATVVGPEVHPIHFSFILNKSLSGTGWILGDSELHHPDPLLRD